jgi:hypothetical protein
MTRWWTLESEAENAQGCHRQPEKWFEKGDEDAKLGIMVGIALIPKLIFF